MMEVRLLSILKVWRNTLIHVERSVRKLDKKKECFTYILLFGYFDCLEDLESPLAWQKMGAKHLPYLDSCLDSPPLCGVWFKYFGY